MTCHRDSLTVLVNEEIAFLDGAISACDWRFNQLTALESRRAALVWVLAQIEWPECGR